VRNFRDDNLQSATNRLTFDISNLMITGCGDTRTSTSQLSTVHGRQAHNPIIELLHSSHSHRPEDSSRSSPPPIRDLPLITKQKRDQT
jgi:hypothetical protein